MASELGDITSQITNIVMTEGDIQALKDARAIPGNEKLSAKELRETQIYKDTVKDYGTGGKYQQVAQAVSGAVSGLFNGDMNSAVAGAAAPYLATLVKANTPEGAQRLIAHAVAGAAIAQMQGKDAAAGALGAATGEATTSIALDLWGKRPEELDEGQRQLVSKLASVAAGVAGAAIADNTAGAKAAAEGGKNSSENNGLYDGNLGQYVNAQGSLAFNTNLLDENGYVMNPATDEQIRAGSAQLAKGDMPEGTNITKVVVDGSVDGALIFGGWSYGLSVSAGKAIGSGVISSGVDAITQWDDLNQPGNEKMTWNYKSTFSSFVEGTLGAGRNKLSNACIALGGSIFVDGIDYKKNITSMGGSFYGAKMEDSLPFNEVVNEILGTFADKAAGKFSQNTWEEYEKNSN